VGIDRLLAEKLQNRDAVMTIHHIVGRANLQQLDGGQGVTHAQGSEDAYPARAAGFAQGMEGGIETGGAAQAALDVADGHGDDATGVAGRANGLAIERAELVRAAQEPGE